MGKEYKFFLGNKNFLYNARRKQGYTQIEFEKKYKIKGYGCKELGMTGLSYSDLVKISEALGLGERLFKLKI